MKKRLLTILIISTLLCSGCLESFTSEYKRCYDDGYNNPDEETLQCAIDYYNKCIDYYTTTNTIHYDISHIKIVTCTWSNGVVWRGYGYDVKERRGTISYGCPVHGMRMNMAVSGTGGYIRLTDMDYELYCYGYLEGASDRMNEEYRDSLDITKANLTAELNNMSECR